MSEKIRIYNAETGENVLREMTSEELAELQEAAELNDSRIAEEQAKASAKQAAQDKLKALGLTDLEIAALVGA